MRPQATGHCVNIASEHVSVVTRVQSYGATLVNQNVLLRMRFIAKFNDRCFTAAFEGHGSWQFSERGYSYKA